MKCHLVWLSHLVHRWQFSRLGGIHDTLLIICPGISCLDLEVVPLVFVACGCTPACVLLAPHACICCLANTLVKVAATPFAAQASQASAVHSSTARRFKQDGGVCRRDLVLIVEGNGPNPAERSGALAAGRRCCKLFKHVELWLCPAASMDA